MLHTMLKKWWLILVQGILMIILSIFIFNNADAVLAGISIWFGVIVLLTGVVGVISWLASTTSERETGSLIWSLLTGLFGVLMLMHLFATMKMLTIIFGIWMLLTGYNLFSSGWPIRNEGWLGWLLVIVGILSFIAGVVMITNIGAGAIGISALLGFQVLLSGIVMVILAFVKKAVVNKITGKVEELKSRMGS
ncbi:MAG: DUF308 domain-containing protein [Chitinophagales bacterium]